MTALHDDRWHTPGPLPPPPADPQDDAIDDPSPYANAPDSEQPDVHRRVMLTRASEIKPRRVIWLWEMRIALGTIALLAGPEGLGKSTLIAWSIALITRGQLPGENFGNPKSVLVCATEDSWEHTIVPRLMAAGADLDRVYRVEVKTADRFLTGLTLPRDLAQLEILAVQTDAALLVLDPLMSRLANNLDTHRDSEVRRALEPLAALADRARVAVLGIIHHNKSGSTDPLQLVMASKAFTAVARSVHTVIRDPDDETDTRRLFGTPKNNLGRGDLPTLAFTVASHPIDTPDGTAWTGRLEWTGEVPGTISDAIRRAGTDPDDRTATAEAGEWLLDYLSHNGSTAKSADIKRHGHTAGHSPDALKRARRRHNLTVESQGFPRISYWSLPETQLEHQSEQAPRGDAPTALTAPTGQKNTQPVQLALSEQETETTAPTATPTRRKKPS